MDKSNQQITGAGADYTAAWDRFRRGQKWFCGIFVSGLALMLAATLLFDNESLRGWVVLPVLPILILTFVVASIHHVLFRCSRCGHFFFLRFLYRNPIARRCLHCGLPKWAKNDSPEEDS